MSPTSTMPQVGDPAPPIDTRTASGDRFSLAEQHGSWVVLFFYPMANTPGWTHESKDFQAHLSALESLSAQVVGVSGDKPESQIKFVEKYNLTYPMLPDADKRIINAYGARGVLGLAAKRSTFLVDPEGRVAHVWPNVKIDGHAEQVVDTIRALSSAAAGPDEAASGSS